MNAPVDLAEFRGAYLLEAEELVASANRSLLQAEAAVRAGESSVRAVRELFRAVHTIKGLSAMVGIEPIVAISHRMEAALRPANRSGEKLALPVIDVLLRGVRAIEHRIQALDEGKPIAEPSTELLAALDAIETTSSGRPATVSSTLVIAPNIDAKLTAADREQLEQGARKGQRALRLDFTPSPERASAGFNITTVRQRIGSIAEIVKVVPLSLRDTPQSPERLVFALLLLTTSTDDALLAAAGVDANELHDLVPRAAGDGAAFEEAFDDSAREDSGEWETSGVEVRQQGVVRVDVARLDDAMERLSALIVTRFRLAHAVAALRESGADVRALSEILVDNARQLRDLRAAILRVRMVRVSEMLASMPLLVRGLSRTTGRQVRLDVQAGDAELDKSVAERIFPALVHLVRNAVDHAIEPPEERARLGKPVEGTLSFTSHERANNQLELSIRDDGRGIDAAAVARKARREVPADDRALLELLCLPGLSTRDEATTTSGRGMGMDIVKRIVVEQLGGELLLTTTPGVGTTFVLRVPLTISIVDAFTFECAAQRFVVPVAMVEEIVELDPKTLVRGPARPGAISSGLLERRGEAIPVVALESLFGLGTSGEQARRALVVRRNGQPTAFAVDRLLGQGEVVVRPLEDPLVKSIGVSGATDLGDGKPTLVLDLSALGATLTTTTTTKTSTEGAR